VAPDGGGAAAGSAPRAPARRLRVRPSSRPGDAQLQGGRRPQERRDEIATFLEQHRGVEAYVEPKTVISPKSVVLVDEVGEWRRFELKEDAYLRHLAAERGLPILDASITGYPPRMRRRPAG
jgi:hypothetical protein